MIPNKDIYVDADGKVTDDPNKYARQIAVAGHELDERIAKRYGIEDTLVSVDEPGAVRKVRSQPAAKRSKSAKKTASAAAEPKSKASVKIEKVNEKTAAEEGAETK